MYIRHGGAASLVHRAEHVERCRRPPEHAAAPIIFETDQLRHDRKGQVLRQICHSIELLPFQEVIDEPPCFCPDLRTDLLEGSRRQGSADDRPEPIVQRRITRESRTSRHFVDIAVGCDAIR
ncbi:hypothetical protein [Bradyrhizobium japonicum]|uniref:hypothetical protein n=1 Tax=Bradyrhizobium japonicum TaxID=375 RepID=UPI0020117E8C|nr:hypothetical protein [Bradyrhizobium japonicum]